MSHRDVFVVEILHDPDLRQIDLSAFADALLLLHSNHDLNTALSLSHDLNSRRLARDLHRQTVQSIAEYHRAQIAHCERELGDID